jgi:hypothetical protein
VNGETFAVADVIRFVANVQGGVHRREPKNAIERAVATAHGTVFQDGAYSQLAPIAKIAIRALEPLELVIREGTAEPPGPGVA